MLGLGLGLGNGQALGCLSCSLIRIYGLAMAASLIHATLFPLGQSDSHATIAGL